VTTTAFITHCWKSARLDFAVLLCCASLMVVLPQIAQAESATTEVSSLQFERNADSLLLTAAVNFSLPATVEDALLKGVPVIFVAEADIFRERWYWLDKRVVSTQRHMRLVYQPLTQRWRLAVASGLITNNGLGVALNQTFDTLEEALGVIRRVSGWQIAELAELEPGARYRVDFFFRLDVTQLPRPLQIGVLGQSDWSLSTSATRRLDLENLK
jgi:Domain of unknown function (DUF4390)